MNHEEYIHLVDQGKYPTNPRVPLPEGYKDTRGIIQNLLLTTVSNVALVTSKKGSTRSNHYHKEDWHYLYVVSGSLNYYERDIDGSGDVEPLIIKAGELIFTPPLKVHKTVFLEDTIMISMGKKSQDHVHHEEDVVRVPF
jgi:quercetin dioxygenase-like cupin family protein